MNYLDTPVKTVCIDAANKPNEIKISNWVVKDREYTIIATARMIMSNELGYKLAEIDTECPEYPYYRSTRFGINIKDVEKLFKIQEDINVEELLTEHVEI
jgi:hypothetical protein